MNLFILLFTFIWAFHVSWASAGRGGQGDTPKVYLKPEPGDDIFSFCRNKKHFTQTCIGDNLPKNSYLFWYNKTGSEITTIDNPHALKESYDPLNQWLQINIYLDKYAENVSVYCAAIQNGYDIARTKTITFKRKCKKYKKRRGDIEDDEEAEEVKPKNKDLKNDDNAELSPVEIIAIVLGLSLVLVLTLISIYFYRRRQQQSQMNSYGQSNRNEPEYAIPITNKTSAIVYASLNLPSGTNRKVTQELSPYASIAGQLIPKNNHTLYKN